MQLGLKLLISGLVGNLIEGHPLLDVWLALESFVDLFDRDFRSLVADIFSHPGQLFE
jgi:hypothetical protein